MSINLPYIPINCTFKQQTFSKYGSMYSNKIIPYIIPYTIYIIYIIYIINFFQKNYKNFFLHKIKIKMFPCLMSKRFVNHFYHLRIFNYHLLVVRLN